MLCIQIIKRLRQSEHTPRMFQSSSSSLKIKSYIHMYVLLMPLLVVEKSEQIEDIFKA